MVSPEVLKLSLIATVLENTDQQDDKDAKRAIETIRALLEIAAK